MTETRMDRIERLGTTGMQEALRRKERPPVRFLPEPDPRPRELAIISVDDHVIEPADMFEGRIPSRFEELGPVVVELENGTQLWRIEDQLVPNIGLNATVGKEEGCTTEPQRFDEMRRGTWDIEARIRDLDIDGVWASLCFPSALSGFAGWKYSRLKNQEFGFAAMRAWNDWLIEVWAGTHPDRII
ncbi:MAG: amidohydrolase family protein, partial [Acidimicrobiales bacterium]